MITIAAVTDQRPHDAGFTTDCGLFDENKPLERILIVDDEETIRNLFAFCLENRYVCVEAASVAEALERIAETEFELIITDLMMPDLSGVDLLDRVAEISPDTAVIMASGIGDPHSALEAVRRGAFDYLTKPCNMSDLELTVERALDNRRFKLEARRYKNDAENRSRELARGTAEIERLRAQVVRQEKMASLGRLAADIVHEINNPVGFVYGNLAVLKQYVADLRELLECYDAAETNGTINQDAAVKQRIGYKTLLEDFSALLADCCEGTERIAEIARNLQTFSRFDDARPSKTDVHAGIDQTARLLSRYFKTGKLTLVRDYAELPLIDAFADQLNQIWLHLLVNAAEAVGENAGRITIKTSVTNNSVGVEISDSGGGIAPEHLNRIFEPFYTTKAGGEHFGLGLSTAADIAARHSGTISVESSAANGALFTVRLPIDNPKLSDERSDSES